MAESLSGEKSSSDANRQAVVGKVGVLVTSGVARARVRSPSGGGGIFRVRLVGVVWNGLEIAMQFEQRYVLGSRGTTEAKLML